MPLEIGEFDTSDEESLVQLWTFDAELASKGGGFKTAHFVPRERVCFPQG
jgi:hypothetical protein